jgi:hypothetical protein
VLYEGPLYAWLHHTVAALLERAMAVGETPPLDAAWFADALLATVAIDLYRFQRQGRGFAPERVTAAVRQLLTSLRADGGDP